jgi:hypothetical protein
LIRVFKKKKKKKKNKNKQMSSKNSLSSSSNNINAMLDKLNAVFITNSPTWQYFGDAHQWIILGTEDQNSLEEEYQRHLSGNSYGQRVFHCFGNGYSAVIDYNNMRTECGSGRCMLKHDKDGEKPGLPRNHMVYKLQRSTNNN